MDVLGNTIQKSLKQKKEHHHRILHIQISLGSKSQFQQTILIFGNKFAIKKSIVKKMKRMNIPIEFYILELV